MPVRLNGATSGYVEVAAPDTASNATITLPNTSATLANTAQLGVGKNRIINGDFSVWQRGTSNVSVGNNAAAFHADRWRHATGNGGAATLSQQTFTPGNPISGYEPRFFLRHQQTTGGTRTGSSFEGPMLHQFIEDVRTLAGQTATVSFWAKAAANMTVTVGWNQGFGSGGSSAVLNGSGFGSVSVTTSWQRFTLTATLPSVSGKTIGDGSSWRLLFYFPESSTFTFDIWGVQVEAGYSATPFEVEPYAETLRKCHRYYQRFSNTGATTGAIPLCPDIGFAATTTVGYVVVKPIVPLRTNLSSNSQISFSGLYFDNQATYGSAVTGVILNPNGGTRQTNNTISLYLSGMSGLAANTNYWITTSASTGYLAFDVEL